MRRILNRDYPPGTEPGALQHHPHEDSHYFGTQNASAPPAGNTFQETMGSIAQWSTPDDDDIWAVPPGDDALPPPPTSPARPGKTPNPACKAIGSAGTPAAARRPGTT